MKNIASLLLFLFGFVQIISAQVKTLDSTSVKSLDEVIVIGKKSELYQKQEKPLATIDEYLQKSNKVDMVKRGSYAWEPIINSMATERTVISIDGMRIFGACTDKMDPITSYVEVSNLSEATISSGQQGSCHGATIGGSIDLKRNRSGFVNNGWETGANLGYEFNGQQKIIGAMVNYTDSLFYVDTDFTYRAAKNYYDGRNQEILYSQFNKYNFSTTVGYALNPKNSFDASLIYDYAFNVGYPALPMDVSSAKAIITSLKYYYTPENAAIENWETNIYFNQITHIMDDTKRAFVPIHMDMPGWSTTFGFYSSANAELGNHFFKANINGFYNRSIAEMTMYPNNSNEALMFMYTWPDVLTRYAGIYLEDNVALNCHSNIKLTASIGNHHNKVDSKMGLESLQIFYPDMSATKDRILSGISATYFNNHDGFEYSFGLAFGQRAPSVSEGYGFYLFNSFDLYDYIGNPEMANENALEASGSIGYGTGKFKTKLSASYFHISNYIVGIPDANFLAMTIGASGVKVYNSLDYATIFNTDLNVEYKIASNLFSQANLTYSYGQDYLNQNLPFISPLSYKVALNYRKSKFSTNVELQGNATQTNFAPFFGEDKTPSYAILNWSGNYNFNIQNTKLNLGVGLENLLNTYYSTYASWNNIPSKGRNFFVNMTFKY